MTKVKKIKEEDNFNVTGKFLDNRSKNKKSGDSDSGLTRYYTDDVTSEHDTCLQGQAGSIALKKMSRTDSMIGGILRNYENPIQSAKWALDEIPDATPQEQEVLDTLNEWFFQRNNFGTLLTQILGMLPVGFSLFEKYFTAVEFDNGKFMMPVLAERTQTSIRKIDYKMLQVEQHTTNGNLIYMDFKDLVFFSFRQEGNDRRGVSLLRQAYDDYLDKKEVKKASKKGIIRALIGLITGMTPEGVNVNSKEFESFSDLVEMLGERDYNGISDSAVIPIGYELKILNSVFNLDQMKNYIAYIDSSMAMSVLTQFMNLGQSGGGGAFSLGRDSSDMFLNGLQFIIDYVGKQFSQQVVHQAVAMNWAGVDPKKFNITGTNLDKKNSKEFADTLKVLIDSGFIQAVPEDEVKIRKMYGLPEIDIELREKEKEEEEGKLDEEETEGLQEEAENKEEKQEEKQETIKLSEKWNTAKQRRAYLDQEVKKLSKFSRANLQLTADEFNKSLRRQLNKGGVEAQGLKDLKISTVGSYKKGLGQKLAGIANQGWKNALRNSKGKLKLSEVKPSDLPTQVLTSFVINQSDTMIEKQINDIREDAILVANTQSGKGLSTNNTMAMVEDKTDNYIDNKNKIEGGTELAIIQAMNFGEMQYYKSIEDDLWGFRFSNDVPETEICKSLVGKTYAKDSTELDMIQPPLHFRCDSFLVPIYKSDSPEKPAIDNFIPSDTILKQKTI